MNVLLIDVDSTIPNLALMKISAYHKLQGDYVGFNIDSFWACDIEEYKRKK